MLAGVGDGRAVSVSVAVLVAVSSTGAITSVGASGGGGTGVSKTAVAQGTGVSCSWAPATPAGTNESEQKTHTAQRTKANHHAAMRCGPVGWGSFSRWGRRSKGTMRYAKAGCAALRSLLNSKTRPPY